MPQMSPCLWLTLMLTSNLMLYVIKMNIFFEKKC